MMKGDARSIDYSSYELRTKVTLGGHRGICRVSGRTDYGIY